MGHAKQKSFFKTNWKHHLTHGGVLRQKRAGRGQRPLSTKEPLHVVFKVNRERLKHGGLRHGVTYTLVQQIVRRWAKYFFVKVEQISIQGDHIHVLVRAPRRAKFHDFFRVVAGQIAQRLEKEGLLAAKDVSTRNAKTANGTNSLPFGSESRPSHPFASKSAKSLPFGSKPWRSQPDGSENPKRNSRVTDTPAGPRTSTDSLKNTGPRAGTVTDTPAGPRKGTGLWKYRPFSRVVRGWRAYKIVREYIQLNELEAQGRIPYRKSRLKGLSSADWEILWA
jgi:REP element-mobilizing transposase RayT